MSDQAERITAILKELDPCTWENVLATVMADVLASAHFSTTAIWQGLREQTQTILMEREEDDEC